MSALGIILVIAVFTGCVLIALIFAGVLFRKVPLIREYTITQCTEHEQHHDIPPKVPEEIFFDDHDVSAMEAHEEYPDYHGTVVEINGIKVLPDGMTPEEPGKKGWFRR